MQNGDLGLTRRTVAIILPVGHEIEPDVGDDRLQRIGLNHPFAIRIGAAVTGRHIQVKHGAIVQDELRAVGLHGYNALALNPFTDTRRGNEI